MPRGFVLNHEIRRIHRQSLLDKMIEHEVFLFGEFIFKNLEKMPLYCNLRKIQSIPEVRHLAIKLLTDLVDSSDDDFQFTFISGVTEGGVALGNILADRFLVGHLYVRKEVKGHGIAAKIDGDFSRGDKVLVFEDTVTTGGSVLEHCLKLRREGLKVTKAVSLLDYNLGASSLLSGRGIQLYPLFVIDAPLLRMSSKNKNAAAYAALQLIKKIRAELVQPT